MQSNQIDKILEKYFDGSTTVEEEKFLRDYFSGDHIREDHLQFMALFSGLDDLSKKEKNPSLHEKIFAEINKIDKVEKHNSKRIWVQSLAAVAAVAAIMIMLLKPANQQWTDTYDDPQQAYMEAKKTLMYVSEKYNKGISQLKYVDKIDQSLEPMNKSLSTINKGVATLNKTVNINNLKQIQEEK